MNETFLPENEEFMEVDGVLLLNKTNLKKFDVETPDINEARFLIDNYYQIQQMRINTANQIRAIAQGADNKSSKEELNDKKISTSMLLYDQYVTMEDNAKKLLEAFINSNYLSRWASKVTGIGPILAASLAAYLTIKEEPDGSTNMHAGSWWNYCGLNDNNNPWLGAAKSKEIVEKCIEENGGKLDDDTMLLICARSKWKMEHFRNFKDCYKETKKGGKWNKEQVIKACSTIPYNKDLKVVCHKIGTSFHKCCNNDKSLYGRLFKERLAYELNKNDKGDYADQAAEILEEKHFKNKEIEAVYKSGKLPISHIYARCERYVTKLFISHAFEAAYWDKYGEMAPAPYILMFSEGKHTDYVGPEVPYDETKW